MKKDFCCYPMQTLVEGEDVPLKYYPYIREYFLTVPPFFQKKSKRHNIIYPRFTIDYCPRCGTKLPESLFDQWYDIMEKEFGLSGLIGPDEAHLIPEEYKTDEWWKKRGL